MRPIESYRAEIEAALGPEAQRSHEFEDVVAAVNAGTMQFWPAPNAVLITEVAQYPRCKEVHAFLAGGKMEEVIALTEIVIDWAKSQGCTRSSLIGRRGWGRSFLTKTGWTVCDWVRMEKMI